MRCETFRVLSSFAVTRIEHQQLSYHFALCFECREWLELRDTLDEVKFELGSGD